MRADDQHRGHHLDDGVGAPFEEALQLVDVVVEDRHQAAGAAILKVGQFQLLHVVIGVQAQLVLHGLGQVAPQHAGGVLEADSSAPDDQRQARPGPAAACYVGDAQIWARNESSCWTTTSTATPISTGGARSKTLLSTEVAEARRTRC